MMTVSIPTVEGNEMIKSGKMGEFLETTLAELKPESAYFTSIDGNRTGVIVFDLKDPSHIPIVAEPWFLTFNATVDLRPAMTLDDFKKAGENLLPIVQAHL